MGDETTGIGQSFFPLLPADLTVYCLRHTGPRAMTAGYMRMTLVCLLASLLLSLPDGSTASTVYSLRTGPLFGSVWLVVNNTVVASHINSTTLLPVAEVASEYGK